MQARNLNHYSNKASYKPADVIAAVDKSFTSNADDALLTYPNTNNDDINFWGRTQKQHHVVPPDAVRRQPDERHGSSAEWSIRA